MSLSPPVGRPGCFFCFWRRPHAMPETCDLRSSSQPRLFCVIIDRDRLLLEDASHRPQRLRRWLRPRPMVPWSLRGFLLPWRSATCRSMDYELGATPPRTHEQIASNIGAPLKLAMNQHGCRTYQDDIRVQASDNSNAHAKYRPDVVVQCGPERTKPTSQTKLLLSKSSRRRRWTMTAAGNFAFIRTFQRSNTLFSSTSTK
jgi:hypothetical protein